MATTSRNGKKLNGLEEMSNFILDTQNGKYTEKKPDIAQTIKYVRLHIPNWSVANVIDDEVILYGISGGN
ncbi:MAG: hypothetical protein LBB79_02210 [Prevotellaceae bacterium]|jgi:hypothetical protein|nr:hypothetical protein [Prevotellaceae bacterium]